MCTFYILYSKTLDKYYVGYTCDNMQERLRKHNSNHNGFTGKTNDWNVAYFENYDTNTMAHRRELEVKRWKSRKRIEQLVGSRHSGS